MSQAGILSDSTSAAPDIETLSGDAGGIVGPDAAFNINVLGNPDIDVVGTPASNQLQLTNLTKLTAFVVDAVAGAAPYQTIQAALTAAGAIGNPALIYVKPGTYTEDLTFPDINITVSGDRGGNAIIVGTHIPSDTDNLELHQLQLQDATDILNSADVGVGTIEISSCFITVTNGFVFNLPNWIGTFLFDDCGEGSTNDGVVNNTTGVTIKFLNTEMGAGSGQTMTLTGNANVRFDTCNINCPVNIAGAGTIIVQNGTKFANTVTVGGSKSGTITNAAFLTEANAAFIMNSSGDILLNTITLDSSNATPIQGAGAGALSIFNIGASDEQQIAATVNTPFLHYDVNGNDSTVGAVTADLITYALRNVTAVYQFTVDVSGISATGDAIGGRLVGTIKTTGAASSIVNTVDQTINSDAALAVADVTVIAAGNNLIVRATGVAGETISWNAYLHLLLIN